MKYIFHETSFCSALLLLFFFFSFYFRLPLLNRPSIQTMSNPSTNKVVRDSLSDYHQLLVFPATQKTDIFDVSSFTNVLVNTYSHRRSLLLMVVLLFSLLPSVICVEDGKQQRASGIHINSVKNNVGLAGVRHTGQVSFLCKMLLSMMKCMLSLSLMFVIFLLSANR